MPARSIQKYQIERDVSVKKNVVMNGDFAIWQRGTTFSAISGSSDRYVADRWRFSTNLSGTWEVSRNSDVPSNNEAFSMNVQCTGGDPIVNAGDFAGLTHFIEGSNYKPIYQRFQILSFWVKSNIVGTYHAVWRNAGFDRSYVIPFTINVSDAWERKELVVENPVASGGTWNFTNGVGAYLTFTFVSGTMFQTATPEQWIGGSFIATSSQANLGSVALNYIRFAGIQLEEGQIATPFQFVGIDEELARCQRYYEIGFYAESAQQNNGAFAEIYTNEQYVPFITTKRTNPSVVPNILFGGLTGISFMNPPFVVSAFPNGFVVEYAVDAGIGAAGDASIGTGISPWTADAELS